MIKETVKDIFLNKDRSCAESVFLAANEAYGLNASEDAIKAVGAFSGGIGGSERLCGAAAGAVCALGIKYSEGSAHKSKNMSIHSAAFMKEFMEYYGSDLCCVIKPIHRKNDEVRCLSVVEKAVEILDKHMK